MQKLTLPNPPDPSFTGFPCSSVQTLSDDTSIAQLVGVTESGRLGMMFKLDLIKAKVAKQG